MKYKILLVIWLISNYWLMAQSDSLHFEHITIQNGLPHNRVHSILQDRLGFLWFGTQEGLVRYDGYICKVFRQSRLEQNGFMGKNVECLYEDRKGNLWIGMQAEGINVKDATTGIFKNFQNHKAFTPIYGAWVRSIIEDKAGKIWIGTVGKGLLVFDPLSQTAQHFNTQNSDLKDNTVSAIVEDPQDGTVWLSSASTYIYKFNASANRLIPIEFTSPTKYIDFRKTLHLDGKGNLWIGTQNLGLFRYNIAQQSFYQFVKTNDSKGLNSLNVLDIAQTQDGQLLFATDGGGLNIYNPATDKFSVYTYTNQGPNILNANAHYCVFVDKDNNIWIGTINGGVNVYKANKTHFESFTHLGNRINELSHRSIVSITETKNGKIWIGTDGGGLDLFDRRRNAFKKISYINSNTISRNVRSLFQDSKGRLWLGHFNGGIIVLNPETEQPIKYWGHNSENPYSVSSNNIWSFAEDRDGSIWVATERNGLNVCLPEEGRFTRFYHNPMDSTSLSSNSVVTILIDKSNNLWVGTENDGLNLYDRVNKKFIRFKHEINNPLSINANDIRSIFQDSKGRLWIGSESGGLDLFDNGHFKHLTTHNGLNSDAVMGIIEDKNGLIWLSTIKGISRYNPEIQEILNFDFHKTESGNQFNSMVALCASNGELYFGGINGLNIINPQWIRSSNMPPKVILTDFKVFNISINAGKQANGYTYLTTSLENATEINLPYNDNAFSLEFASLDFTEPYKSQYAYKMDGFDNEWQFTTGDKRLITYTNLDPGIYTFRIKTSNASGVWGEEKQIKVHIHPPFWKTWWFYLLCLAIMIGLAALALNIYTNQREMALQQRLLESEREVLNLKNEMLIHEVEDKNSELMSKTAQMAHKDEVLLGVKDQLKGIRDADDLEKRKLLRILTRTLETEVQSEENWLEFTHYFDQVNQNFTKELLKKHPNLTQNDLRICTLTRLNISTKEIASLLNISVKGVQKSRYRLKQRMGLTGEDDLYNYLRQWN